MPTKKRIRGEITFRIAAVLIIISACFELIGVTSGVPLFGEMRGGIGAAIYHLFYAGLYLALGIGIWQATPWGYKLVFITTAVYTLDMAQYLLNSEKMLDSMLRQLVGSREILRMLDKDMLMNAMTIAIFLFTAGWWGFALYTYFRRDYFRLKKDPVDS